MTLTLCDHESTLHIEITADQFRRLRSKDIKPDEIVAIASDCQVSPAILIKYIDDLKTASADSIEIDGACDYTDHF